MIEPACGAFEVLDQAIRFAFVKCAGKIQWIVGEIVADKQIEITVVVVIKERRARTPQFIVDSGAFSDIRKSAVAVVAVKLTRAKASDVNIGPALVCIISNRQSHASHAIRDPGAFGDVSESAVAVIPV